jgi:hypothetical protein
MMDIPTHEEVAAVLDASHPGIAKMLRECDPKRHCWGDLVIRVQEEFTPHEVATAFRRLAMKGWKQNIVMTWCPLTEPVRRKMAEVRGLVDDRASRRSIYGAIVLVRDLWQKTRDEWMRRWALRSDNDPAFFNAIVMYLEALEEEERDEKTRHHGDG